jgi:hypothetical protein
VKNLVYAVLVGASLVGLSLSACTSTTATDSSTSDAGTDDAASPTKDAGSQADTGAADADTDADGGGACNTLVNGAAESTSSTIASAAPTATGGTIVDGTYFQTEFNVYDPSGTPSGPTPSGLKVTLKITGNLMESIQTLPDDSTDTFAETFVVAGTALNRTLTCPKSAADLAATYTVSGSTLTIYETDPTSMLVAGSVYQKQ